MPVEISDNTKLMTMSGALIVVIGISSRWLEVHTGEDKYWHSISSHGRSRRGFPMLFHLQAFLVGLSSVMVPLSTSHRTEKQALHAAHQVLNWLIAGLSVILPLFSSPSILSRLTSIFMGFAPTYLLLSIGYEAIFYATLGLVLVAWVLSENAVFYMNKAERSSMYANIIDDKAIADYENRSLQLSGIRIPLIFMVLFNVAFFGTGNFASIASFEISSVYRFTIVFSPFFMAALLIFNLMIPFLLVMHKSVTKKKKSARMNICTPSMAICAPDWTVESKPISDDKSASAPSIPSAMVAVGMGEYAAASEGVAAARRCSLDFWRCRLCSGDDSADLVTPPIYLRGVTCQ